MTPHPTLFVACVIVCSSSALADPLASPAVKSDAGGSRARAVPAPLQGLDLPPINDRGDPLWTSFGPGGGDVRSMAISPSVAGVVIAGLQNSFGQGALYRSTDFGAGWTQVSSTGNRGIYDVEFASDGTGYAATGDGLFKTTDNGQSWTEVALPTEPASLVQAVEVSATDPATVWVGMGQYLDNSQTQFVLRSTNAGATWTNLSPAASVGKGVTAMGMDPANPQRVFAAFAANFGANGELWVTEDGGATWNDRTAGLPTNIFWDFAFSPGRVYIVGGQDFGSQFVGLFTSTDSGQNWTELSAGWPSQAVTAVAVDPTNPQHLYAGTQRAGLAESTNGGADWTFNVGGTREFPVNDIDIAPGTPASIYLGMGSVAVFKSADGGTTFNPSGSGIRQLNVFSVAANPANPSELALAYQGDNDGGIFTSTDGGANWQLTNSPLPRWTKVVFAPSGTLYATHDGPLGRADDGVWRRETDGTWTGIGPGSPSQLDTLGHDIAVRAGSSGEILFGGQEGFFGGFDAVVWSFNLNNSGAWEKQYEGGIASEEVESVLWLNAGAGPAALASIVNFGQEEGAAGGILRSPDAGDTWARSESGYPAAWHGWQLSSRPSQPQTVYVSASQNTGSMPAAIYKSTDGGVTWNAQGSNQTFRSFLVDPLDLQAMYGVEPFSGRPYRSVDDGVSFSLFDAGLPAGTGGRVLAHGGGAQPRLYLATNVGLFVTDLPAPPCPADFNSDGSVSVQDIFDFLTAYFAGSPAADFNGVGGVTVQDIFDFLGAYFDGCQ